MQVSYRPKCAKSYFLVVDSAILVANLAAYRTALCESCSVIHVRVGLAS